MTHLDAHSGEPLCGLFVAGDGTVHTSHARGDGSRIEVTGHFEPFVWTSEAQPGDTEPSAVKELEGAGLFNHLLYYPSPDALKETVKGWPKEISRELFRPFEHQFLLHTKARHFAGLPFEKLRRLQLDIEVHTSEPPNFPSAQRTHDFVIAIGLRMNGVTEYLEIEELSGAAERELMKRFNARLQELDPDIIEGHNIFDFDLAYLRERCRRMRVPCAWGRFGQTAGFRPSRLRIAERWVDFVRCDIPGRTVFDTLLMVQLYDLTARELQSYGLKHVAQHFRITPADGAGRTYIPGDKIHEQFLSDRETFRAYLADDLRETAGVADLLLPTYVAQAATIPMSLQEICVRGTGQKVDSLFLARYYHQLGALPEPPSVSSFEGGFSKSFETGVFKKVLHYDVASLYPSLLMSIGRAPAADHLGVFIPMLKELKDYRLKYKKLAKDATEPSLKTEYDARQASFKILINSFYGYLGFAGARFADSELAAEVTARGRDLLQELIARFQKIGCTVLEADTDGIYLSPQDAAAWEEPERLLEAVADLLPEGIALEFGGRYEAMLCYKAKNYALFDGGKVLIRGSALRSRGTEPFLKKLTSQLISFCLGASKDNPREMAEAIREQINAGEMEVYQLSRRENLSMSPAKYQQQIETSKKPRRAALEVALQMEPIPKMGATVRYFITTGEKKKNPDWQVARPLDRFDPVSCPYDPTYYTRKLDEWLKRYHAFLPQPEKPVQGELF